MNKLGGKIAGDLASNMAKEGSEKIAKSTLKQGLKNASSELAENIVKKTLKESTESTAKSSTKKIIKRVALGGAALGGAAIAGYMIFKPLADVERINKTNYTITEITDVSTGSQTLTQIKFNPPESVLAEDILIISETNSSPNINGQYSDTLFAGKGTVIIKNRKITTKGSAGVLKIKTEYNERLKEELKDTGGLAAAPLSGFTGAALQPLKDVFGDNLVVVIGLVACIVLMIVLFK